MIRTARGRVAAVALLLVAHGGLFVLYAQQPVNPDAWVLATPDEFIATPSVYLNERVVAGGIVQETAPIRIRITTTQGTHLLTITGTGITPDRGDKVRVYGILTDSRTIRALHAFVVPRSGLWYTWSVSFLAGVWVLLRVIRDWTVDPAALAVFPRATPRSPRALVQWVVFWGREEQDA